VISVRNPRIRVIRTAIGAAVALSLATACSNSGSSDSTDNANAMPSKPAVSTSAPADTASLTPSASETAVSNGPTIKLSWCAAHDGVRSIQFFDPETKDGNTVYFTLEPMKYQAPTADCNSNADGRTARQAVNEDYTLLAAQEDATSHIGTIKSSSTPETTTTFEDLSSVTEGGFGVEPKQSDGAFGTDGKLYFNEDTGDGDTLMSVDPTPGSTPEKVAGGKTSNLVDTNKVTSKDGSWGLWYDANDGSLKYGKPGSSGTGLEIEYGHTLFPLAVDGASKTKFIGWNDKDQIVRATINGTHVTEDDVLPKTDGTISEPTVSPDGTQAAFIMEKTDDSGQTKIRALYVVSLTGTGTNEPTLVKDLNTDEFAATANDTIRILDWS
jgi:hypothetical protein